MAQGYEVVFTNRAKRDLKGLPRDVQRRIMKKLRFLEHDPRGRSVKKLSGGDDLYRLHVGSYRVVFTIEDDRLVVVVVRIGHRSDIYRML